MKILHVVPCFDEANGVYQVARMLTHEQNATLMTAAEFVHSTEPITDYDEVWVHGMWLPIEWRACRKVLKAKGPKLVRMTHGSLSPVYLKYQSKWKKRLVAPIERWLYRRTLRVVATCEAEREWIAAYLGRRCPPIEVQDIRRFFRLEGPIADPRARGRRPLHVLYLGRPHPLKGIPFLEKAVNDLNSSAVHLQPPTSTSSSPLDLRIVSNAFGDEKAAVWQWADILCLPTISDNLGLVIAEALERGKFVITTDGAPAWERFFNDHPDNGIYLKGYRNSDDQTRIKLLSAALRRYL